MVRNAIPHEQLHEIATRFGIRLAKGQFVDMADEAIDIGRNGGFPVVLALVPVQGSGTEIVVRHLKTPEQIRRAYERLAGFISTNPGARIMAHREIGGQRELSLSGYLDDAGRKLIELSAPAREGGGREVTADVLPVHEAEADAMVRALRDKHVLPTDHHILRTLADLIVRAAKMFETTPITGFVFDPVSLSPNTYEVLSATMTSEKHLGRQPHKMTRRERDRKGYYTPSGRQ
ncbi:MAG TPA: acetate--CoA ligase family protein [Candidatus Dormibacteraeota bacterium]|nr:acetate--CoA ligase family protein [Candidatus Dormibacteraeota bacterium]